jgi:hypothetical protein
MVSTMPNDLHLLSLADMCRYIHLAIVPIYCYDDVFTFIRGSFAVWEKFLCCKLKFIEGC